jgi:glycosyltransferase involved in cell wall biosynthesis
VVARWNLDEDLPPARSTGGTGGHVMQIAIIDGDVAYPATSGKRLRTLQLMQRLAPHHQITYVGRCAAGSVEDRLAPDYLRERGIEPVLVHDPVPSAGGLRSCAGRARSLLSPLPGAVAAHRSPAMTAAVAAIAERQQVDLWQCEWTPYLGVVPRDHGAPRLLMAHQVDSVVWRRRYDNAAWGPSKLYLRSQWKKFERYEYDTLVWADEVVAVSADDADVIATRFAQPDVDVVENGFDRDYFANVSGSRQPGTILFLGALDGAPNLDAVELLLKRVFPQVRVLVPEARLWIVGRKPSPRLAARIARTPGAELHADVADVRPYLAQATVMAVPLRLGGGARLKVIEALACALPVVSTRIGAEGLSLTPGEHYEVADECSLAAALAAVLKAPARALAQAERGRRLVHERYDWDVLAQKLEEIWEQCATRPPRSAAEGLQVAFM